ncbi:MAG: flavodoxin family protein [Anaerolineae bacterium]|nr:flavodoxin family protein [Anaerolineae bacterium]
MKCLVLYHSRGGNTRTTAEAIAQAARDQGYEAAVKSIIEVQAADINTADVLFIGTWVQGFILFGVKPADAQLWVKSLPSLANKPTGIFCTYAFNPRSALKKLASMLKEKGATIVAQQAFNRNHLTTGVDGFVQRVMDSRQRIAV